MDLFILLHTELPVLDAPSRKFLKPSRLISQERYTIIADYIIRISSTYMK
jgi:hypothetical protein